MIDRHFGLTWFEKVDDLPDGVLVRQTAREGQHMDLMLHTPAELLRAAGWMPPVAVDASAREVESMSKIVMITTLDPTYIAPVPAAPKGGGGGKGKAAGGKGRAGGRKSGEEEGEQLRQAKKASKQHLERAEEVGAKEKKAEAGALVLEYLLFGATSWNWW